MRTLISILILLSLPLSLLGQNSIDKVLEMIEQNNTSLKALREETYAGKIGNKTELTLPNPEVEYGYHWGKPSEIGGRTVFGVSQTFDIPTITGMKSGLSKEKDALLDRQYRSLRMEILLEAKQCCIDLIYYNALAEELSVRLHHAEVIASGYKSRMDKGDTNIIEYNKVRLTLTEAQNALRLIEVERRSLLSQLRRLNGDIELSLSTKSYPQELLPLDFDSWYRQVEPLSPALTIARQEVEIRKRQVSLSKAMGLPTFSAGYASEKVANEEFRGLSVGISIPLWENKNKVRAAKASVKAAEARETDTRRSLYHSLRSLYERAQALYEISETYRKTLSETNNAELLQKALTAGELSLLDYILEIGLYYDSVNQMLQTERDYQKTLAELLAVGL